MFQYMILRLIDVTPIVSERYSCNLHGELIWLSFKLVWVHHLGLNLIFFMGDSLAESSLPTDNDRHVGTRN